MVKIKINSHYHNKRVKLAQKTRHVDFAANSNGRDGGESSLTDGLKNVPVYYNAESKNPNALLKEDSQKDTIRPPSSTYMGQKEIALVSVNRSEHDMRLGEKPY